MTPTRSATYQNTTPLATNRAFPSSCPCTSRVVVDFCNCFTSRAVLVKVYWWIVHEFYQSRIQRCVQIYLFFSGQVGWDATGFCSILDHGSDQIGARSAFTLLCDIAEWFAQWHPGAIANAMFTISCLLVHARS